MIFAYTGKTGSGKTFQMIKDVYPQWLRGDDIYSNTKLEYEYISRSVAGSNILDNPEYFTGFEKIIEMIGFIWTYKLFKKDYWPRSRGNIIYFEEIVELLEIKNGIIILDEGQNLLEARNWENLPLEFSNKLRQHRKHKLDLYTTTQNLGTIDINYRRLVQHWIHCKDIFAVLWKRNPSWLTVHTKEVKDIDQLYNNVDDLLVESLNKKYFIIHKFRPRLYDTLFDIGFKAYQLVWLEENYQKVGLIMPKHWKLEKGRNTLLLMRFYFTQDKSKSI